MNAPERRQRMLTLAAVVAVAALAGCDRASPTEPPTLRKTSANYDPGKPLHAPAYFDPSVPGAVACSSMIVSGTVLKVVDGRPGRMITTLQVTRWVKPNSGPRQIQLNTVDIAAEGVDVRWRSQQKLYLAIDVDPDALPNTVTRADFAKYAAAVPQASKLTCPYGPS